MVPRPFCIVNLLWKPADRRMKMSVLYRRHRPLVNLRTSTFTMYMVGWMLAFLLGSCRKDHAPDPNTPYPVQVQLQLDMSSMLEWDVSDELLPATTSRENPEGNSLRMIIRAYAAAERAAQDSCVHEWMFVQATEKTQLLPIELPFGNYRLRIWADHPSEETGRYFYDANDFQNITVNEPHIGNTARRDAFCGTGELNFLPELLQQDTIVRVRIPLQRPLARYRFIATDMEDFLLQEGSMEQLADYRIVLRYAGFMPSAFNLFTDQPSDARTGVSYEGQMTWMDNGEVELCSDYVFVNGSESIVNMQLEVYARSDNQLLSRTPVLNVPLIRNRLTLIKGKFLTSKTSGGISISPDFDGEYNIEIQ